MSKSRTACVLAHLIRCLFYRKGQGCRPVGFCKASGVTRVFGITKGSVHDARRFLVEEIGWLVLQNNDQTTLNRHRLWVTVHLAWGPAELPAEATDRPGRGVPSRAVCPSPLAPPQRPLALNRERKQADFGQRRA
jgi:hypothetical protein